VSLLWLEPCEMCGQEFKNLREAYDHRCSIKKKVDIPKFKIEDDLLSKSVEDDEAAAS